MESGVTYSVGFHMATPTHPKPRPRSARSGLSNAPVTPVREEIARFEADAGDWWRANGAFAALHRLNPVRIAFVRDAAMEHFGREHPDRPLAGLSVLDVGCGGGLLCEPMARLGARVTGIDAGADNIRAAAAHARAAGLAIEYRAAAPEDLISARARFDVVLNMEVVEHVADAGAFVEACAALVRPGGLMVLATLNRTLKSLLLGKVAAEYVLGWIPPGTHDWRKFVRPSEMSAMLDRSGLAATRTAGVVFDPWRGEWRRKDGDLDVNYMMAAVKGREGRRVQLSRRGPRRGKGKTSMPSSSRRRASSRVASP